MKTKTKPIDLHQLLMRSTTTTSRVRASLIFGAALTVWGAESPAAGASDAGGKTLIDYFLPTPIVCPLTSNTWGAAGVVPRDICNGLEDSTNKQWQYWDGKILQGTDATYHMYAGRWPQANGFADWPNSVMVEAVSTSMLMGTYVPDATTPAPLAGKEQNVTGISLRDGGFVLLDSPGNIFSASSLDGPWTSQGVIQITVNGVTSKAATEKNQTIWQSADGSFEIINRTFEEMVSATNVLGPYLVQGTVPDMSGYEDPVIWCSGGQYHMVANNYNARQATHYTSADGLHNWTNKGLAYDPTTDFVRYTDGTVNHWYKMERPGVFLVNGHVVAFTFAVIDVDKTLDLANDNHGSKIIVVPFDGVSFDQDDPGPGGAGCPIDTSEPGDAGQPVGAASPLDAAAVDAGGTTDAGGLVDTAATVDAGETAAAGWPLDAGEESDADTTVDAGAPPEVSGLVDAGGQSADQDAQGVSPSNGHAGTSGSGKTGGCSCETGAGGEANAGASVALLVGLALTASRRRRGSFERFPAPRVCRWGQQPARAPRGEAS
jgi:hypothetical protein